VLIGGPETQAWRWMLGIAAPAGGAVLRPGGAHSRKPALAGQRHRRDEAIAVLRAMGSGPPEDEVREIAESCTRRRSRRTNRSFSESTETDTPGVMVASFNQLAGINALIYYTADIFGWPAPSGRARCCSR
jgi:hypothetical protein